MDNFNQKQLCVKDEWQLASNSYGAWNMYQPAKSNNMVNKLVNDEKKEPQTQIEKDEFTVNSKIDMNLCDEFKPVPIKIISEQEQPNEDIIITNEEPTIEQSNEVNEKPLPEETYNIIEEVQEISETTNACEEVQPEQEKINENTEDSGMKYAFDDIDNMSGYEDDIIEL